MPDEYAPGTPSWVDLAAPDLDGSAAFYSGLFDWESMDAGPAEETGGYRFFTLDGKLVAGYGPPGEGEPPSWRTYVSVSSADDAAGKVGDAGGQVLFGPMDVMEAGRMAVFMDTTGAVVGVWQPGQHKGAQIVNEPGALVWNELDTREPDKAKSFYGAVFGWEAVDRSDGMNYTEWQLEGRAIGGMLEMGDQFPPEVPSNWLPYFAVADCDAAVERTQELGGSVRVPPMDIEQGRLSVLADPAGAPFAVMQARNA